MPRCLVLRFDAPLISFGDVQVDHYGRTLAFPALSQVTGLLGNALGWRRSEGARLQRLQDRLSIAARAELEPHGRVITDFQTVKLAADDRGWTTRGVVEGRAGGASTYDSPHIRYRDYWCDCPTTVLLTLTPAGEAPTLDDLAAALRFPARPLFIGRKPCLPARPLLDANPFVEAASLRDALDMPAPIREQKTGKDSARLLRQWPADGAQPSPGVRREEVTDRRRWQSGVHGGTRVVLVEEPKS